jgi:hypothetical protein
VQVILQGMRRRLLGAGALRALGVRVELAGQDSRLVAGGWLRAHGLIPAGVRRGE